MRSVFWVLVCLVVLPGIFCPPVEKKKVKPPAPAEDPDVKPVEEDEQDNVEVVVKRQAPVHAAPPTVNNTQQQTAPPRWNIADEIIEDDDSDSEEMIGGCSTRSHTFLAKLYVVLDPAKLGVSCCD